MCFKEGMGRIYNTIDKIVSIYIGYYLGCFGFIDFEKKLIYGKNIEFSIILTLIYFLVGFFASLLFFKTVKTFCLYIYEGFST